MTTDDQLVQRLVQQINFEIEAARTDGIDAAMPRQAWLTDLELRPRELVKITYRLLQIAATLAAALEERAGTGDVTAQVITGGYDFQGNDLGSRIQLRLGSDVIDRPHR